MCGEDHLPTSSSEIVESRANTRYGHDTWRL
jgi:hypothetical protein